MWTYKNKKITSLEDCPRGSWGFVYLIEFDNDMKYAGKKCLYSFTRKGAKYESNWLSYTGSCEYCKKGEAKKKNILEFAFSAKELQYLEARWLFKLDVLRKKEFLNKNIDGRYFKRHLNEPAKND